MGSGDAKTERLNTTKVAKLLGVQEKALQRWVREGIIDVETSGSGSRKRIHWDQASVVQARRVRDRVAGDSMLASSIGPDIAAALELARKSRRFKSDDDVIVATANTARIFRQDASLSDVIRRIRGTVFVVLK